MICQIRHIGVGKSQLNASEFVSVFLGKVKRSISPR